MKLRGRSDVFFLSGQIPNLSKDDKSKEILANGGVDRRLLHLLLAETDLANLTVDCLDFTDSGKLWDTPSDPVVVDQMSSLLG